eukprot:COSAG02_NODE_2030_length_10067_cov_22.885333_1_plen_85_part_10
MWCEAACSVVQGRPSKMSTFVVYVPPYQHARVLRFRDPARAALRIPSLAASEYGTRTTVRQIPEVRARAAARGPARSSQPGHIEF